MKRYRITVSCRPNINYLRREQVTCTIEARNMQVALLQAGWIMCVEEKYHAAESINIEMEPL